MPVSIVKCADYSEAAVLAAVRRAVNLVGGIGQFVKPGQKVLLKPNMLAAFAPGKAVSTHPSILKAAIILVKEAGGIPFVGDSPGYSSPHKAHTVCGFEKVCQETGTPFVPLTTRQEVSNPKGLKFKSLNLAKEALEADVIINLSKFKTHQLTGITCAVKNMFGCVPGLLKSEYHVKAIKLTDFSLLLLDILRYLKPALSIADAVVAMEGEGGPAGGTPKELGFIAASPDAIALDHIICEAAGLDPLAFPVNKAAKDNGLYPEKIAMVGDDPSAIREKKFKPIVVTRGTTLPGPAFLRDFLSNGVVEKPTLIKRKCISCKNCEKVCFSKAITFPQKHPVFDYNKCIRCFCCAEMCPVKAIEVKRSRVGEAIYRFLQRMMG